MDESLPKTSADTTPLTPIPQTPPDPVAPKKKFSSLLWPLLLIIGLGVGLAAGYGLAELAPFKRMQNETQQTPVTEKLTLPKDAVQIQSCADNSGALYVRPANIPMGPLYMVYKGQVIGVRYMIPKDQMESGKSFNYLDGRNIKVDHTDIGLLAEGHLGMSVPHYHISLYTVSKDVEANIKCAFGESQEMQMDMPATGSGAMPSAMPSTMPTGDSSASSSMHM